jgi:hypothetical protein
VTRIYTRDDVDAMVFYKYTVEVEPIPAHGQVHVFELTDDREIRLDIAPTTIPRGAYEANFRFDSKGVHRIFARFVPGNPWLPSESEVVEQVVAGIPTESAIRVESAVEGQPIEIRVWVGASLTPYRGIVDLFDTTGDTPIHLGSMDLFEAHPDYLGLARFLLPARDPGTYRLEARYAGTDELYEPSEATGIMVVEPLPPLPPDIDPPTATAPSHRLISGVAISSGRATARLTWSGTDAASGVAGYMLEQQTDGGPWVTVSPSITSTTIDRLLTPQHRYRFRVTPVDAAGNTGAPATGPTFTVSRFSENNSDVKYSGSWKTSKNAVFWGGAARKSLSAGAKASLRFIGRSVAWVARTGPDRGKATVYVNGTRLATIDLYAPTYQRQRVVWAGSWSSAASRLVTIKVSGTSGRPRVDLDAFVTTN